MSSMTNPTVMVFRRRMFCARESGWKPSDWMAARTLPSVPGLTVSGAFRLRETVPTETPETRATSRIVAALSVPFLTQPPCWFPDQFVTSATETLIKPISSVTNALPASR